MQNQEEADDGPTEELSILPVHASTDFGGTALRPPSSARLEDTFDADTDGSSPTGRFPGLPEEPELPSDDADPDGVAILHRTIAALEAIIADKDAEIASLSERLKATRAAVVRRDEAEQQLRAALAGAGAHRKALEARVADAEARAAAYAAQLGARSREPHGSGPPAGPDAAPAGVLVCLTSKPLRAYQLTDLPMLIGSGASCGVRLTSELVDPTHARILRDGSRVLIEDLSSRHGVYVNAARVAREPLQGGNLVTIGDAQFRFDAAPTEDSRARD